VLVNTFSLCYTRLDVFITYYFVCGTESLTPPATGNVINTNRYKTGCRRHVVWYVIQVLKGAEERSACNKTREAIPEGMAANIFVPTYICMRRYQGMWHREQKVLFPGYFFIDTEQPEQVEELLNVLSGIVKPVCVGKDFVPVYAEEQQFLEEMMNAQHEIEMSVGNIINGAFDIYEGPLQKKGSIIRRIDRHKRTGEIEVKLLGEIRRVKVGLEIVEKVENDV
jgi:transcriptional antiterminator NusG